jgi:SAM-dependent methyltransferase
MSIMELLPWERYWQESTDLDFMRDDPDEANHPIRVRMGNEAERVGKEVLRGKVGQSGGWALPSVLDVGCGTAIDYPRLRDLGLEYWAVEPIPKFIERARELHPGIRILQSRVWDIPFTDKRFDVVWCKGVVQHLPPGSYPEALEELWRVTKTLLMVSTNRVFLDSAGLTQRKKGGPYDNHYNFKEFNRHIRRLPNSVSRHLKGFVRPENLEEAKKSGRIHTLFLIYNRDYWREHNEAG